ncbi:MAG: S41 family peptidase [Patescibacteria group bacterium]
MIHGSRARQIVSVAAALAIVGASFFVGALYGAQNRPAIERVAAVIGKQPPPDLAEMDFNLFWDVWSRVEKRFVDRAKIDRKELVEGAIAGLVRGVGDPYTVYLPKEETKQFQEDIAGAFGGIGAEIGIRKAVLTVISPIKGSPAEKSGLKPGDKILQIGATSTADLALEEAVRLIRGEPGTQVTLKVFREATDATKDYTITRDVIKIPVLTTEKKGNDVFVIALHTFTQNSAYEFRRAVQEFFLSGSKRLILDLRNNPGGFLTVSVDIASWFVPAGETIVSERLATGEGDVYRSSGYRLLQDVPTVILINEGSASASEIVAGALRDIKGIKLVGRKTFGKGSVQEVQDLSDGSSLKVTIAKWMTPKGHEIDGVGIEPDILVEIPKDENGETVLDGKDVILEKGIEIVKGL